MQKSERNLTGRLRLTGRVERVEGTERAFIGRQGEEERQQEVIVKADDGRRVCLIMTGTALANAAQAEASGARVEVWYNECHRGLQLRYDYSPQNPAPRPLPPIDLATPAGLQALGMVLQPWVELRATRVAPVA